MSSDAFGTNLLTSACRRRVPRFTPPRRIADIHDTHVSGNEIVKTFQYLWRESDRSGPRTQAEGQAAKPAPVAPASFGATRRTAGYAIRTFTASINALIRARIAAFEPTSASDDAMIP